MKEVKGTRDSNRLGLRREVIEAQLAKSEVPESMRGAIVEYLLYGQYMGSFLGAVFSNDLVGAIGNADMYNRAALHRYAQFLYSYAPRDAWGSRDKVTAWMRARMEEKHGEH